MRILRTRTDFEFDIKHTSPFFRITYWFSVPMAFGDVKDKS